MPVTLAYCAASPAPAAAIAAASPPAEEVRAFFHEALRTSFLIGLTGISVNLPYVRYSAAGSGRIVHQPMADAMAEVLDYASVHEKLRAVLQHSNCELVRALRLEMAERYALTHAADVAAAQVPQ